MARLHLLLLLLLLLDVAVDIAMTSSVLNWLSLGAVPYNSSAPSASGAVDCDRLSSSSLDRRQRSLLCHRHPELFDAVRQASLASVAECRYQFRSERWNCPVDVTTAGADSTTASVLRKTVKAVNKESAFLVAVASAGVAFSVTRQCSSGQLSTCGCDQTAVPDERSRSFLAASSTGGAELRWAGCSDNVGYGAAFARAFVGDGFQDRDVATGGTRAERNRRLERRLVNAHNANAGRKLVEMSRRVQCKCHGLSGSCDVRTCWHALPTFRHVGYSLKQLYVGAQPVRVRSRSPSSSSRQPDRLVAASAPTHFDAAADTSSMSQDVLIDAAIVFSRPSPDYCTPDAARDVVGTAGRQCGDDRTGDAACAQLCCGRGHVTRMRTFVDARCRCRFQYCCYVTCEPCDRTVTEYICR